MSFWHSRSQKKAPFFLHSQKTTRAGVFLTGGPTDPRVHDPVHAQNSQEPQTKRRHPPTAADFFTFGKAEQARGFIQSGRFLIIVIIYLVFTDKSSKLFLQKVLNTQAIFQGSRCSKCSAAEHGHQGAQQIICQKYLIKLLFLASFFLLSNSPRSNLDFI